MDYSREDMQSQKEIQVGNTAASQKEGSTGATDMMKACTRAVEGLVGANSHSPSSRQR